jgi:hypothetical protein
LSSTINSGDILPMTHAKTYLKGMIPICGKCITIVHDSAYKGQVQMPLILLIFDVNQEIIRRFHDAVKTEPLIPRTANGGSILSHFQYL